MNHFKIHNFKVDSHISTPLAATAGRNLDRVLGGKINLEKNRFVLTPGSIPSFCRWEIGKRWGHCESNGRVTEFNGKKHVTL